MILRRESNMPRNFSIAVLLCVLIMSVSSLLAKGGETWLTINARAGLPSNNLTCLAVTDGRMALGSDKGIGLFIANDIRWYNLGDYCPEIKDLPIRSIDFDSYNNIWVATPNGVFCVELEKFPEEPPRASNFNTENGLSTVDTEVLQIVDDILYVGCFGGWLFQTNIFQKAVGITFAPVNSLGMGREEDHRIMSVGVTAIAMDFPDGGGIFSTKGKGLLSAGTGDDYVKNDELPSDWVNDFWSFTEGGDNRVITVTQDKMTLINNAMIVGQAKLPISDCWISCLTTAKDEETEALNRNLQDEDRALDTHLGDRLLYIGTRGQGLWKFDEGRWFNYTRRDCPLPSDNINKVYYLPGAKKIAVLTDAGLTFLGTTEDNQYDEFEYRGSTPYFAKTFWPFMRQWGPYVYGYPDQMQYPIEPYIKYKKLARGKDLWVSHEKGLSRFAFPSAPFLGAMGFRHLFSGRYENPKGDPEKNNEIEDNSLVTDRPPTGEGERLWHHYCKEQPADYTDAPLASIYTSRDMKTIAGPLNMLKIGVDSADNFCPEDHSGAIAAASGTLQYPPVIVLETSEGLFDQRGHKLRSVADQLIECPLHPIPSTDITDFDIDFNERCWVIFDDNYISILESTDYSGGLSFGITHGHEWKDLQQTQVPWGMGTKLVCVRSIGGNIYVGTEKSGMFFLPTAHGHEVEDITADLWKQVETTDEEEDSPETSRKVNEIAYWKTNEGEVVALLHEQTLSIFDGRNLIKIPVPERRYTCMASDRRNNLWLGAMNGLLHIGPDMKIHDIILDSNNFESGRIVCMAAAPNDAKYPYLLAVAYDKLYQTDVPDSWKSSDVPPLLKHDENPYRLRVVNPRITGSRVVLWDGNRWEMLSRPGVLALLFDQRFLWTGTSNRVMRLYIPVEQVPY